MRFSLSDIPAGEAGTDSTVKQIAELVNNSLKGPLVRLKAIRILREARVPNRDAKAAARAIFEYVRRYVRYIPDPIGVETVQAPEVTLKVAAGDCDDHTGLVAALAMSIGIPARYRVIGFSKNEFQHIFPELFINGRWVTADTTGGQRFGQRVQKLPAEKLYQFKGEPVMGIGLGSPRLTVPVRSADVKRAAYIATTNQLTLNWNAGRINRSDIRGYLRLIDEGNSVFRNSIVDVPVRKAIQDFLNRVESTGARSGKPEGSLSGLSGLDGFFKSIVGAVKKAVGAVASGGASLFAGGGGQNQNGLPTFNIKLPDNISLLRSTTPPAAVEAGVGKFLRDPLVLGVVGLAAFILLRK